MAVSFLHSLLFLKNTQFDLFQPYTIACGVLFSIFASCSGSKKEPIIKTAIYSSAFVCILSAFSFLSRRSDYLRDFFTPNFLAIERAFYPFISPNMLGSFLLLVIFPTLTFARKDKRYYFFLILQTASIFMTESIGALTCLAIGISLYIYFLAEEKKLNIRNASLVAACLLLTMVIFLTRQWQGKEHFAPVFSLKERVNYILLGLSMIKEHPIFGWGFGKFHIYTAVKYTHNLIIQLWAETGIISTRSSKSDCLIVLFGGVISLLVNI
jgi:O-antigen ligase